ncbi:hypothetical protein L917_12611 [Phytophthora nicotianae]|uniref:Uncharacterized protein n=1 Tax=Phytophthora nicotianae TaxID=4792 RepID=W2KT03_PHYNI|nr:hypothetical protein L917_12611 [Phytophthora nicotianae]
MRGTKRSVLLGVDRAEVYLDETYCNVNHVTGKIWLTADKIRYGNAGRGARGASQGRLQKAALMLSRRYFKL